MATETTNLETEIASAVGKVIDLAQKGLVEPKVIEVKLDDPEGSELGLKAPVMLLPSMNGQLQSVSAVSIKKFLDEYRAAPERRQGTCVVEDLASMVDHVNRFKDDDSALFACSGLDVPEKKDDGDADEEEESATGSKKLPKPRLVAVLDYHERGSGGAPRFGRHRTKYHFPLSEQWKVWAANSGKLMSQGDFAHFVNDHLMDIYSPESIGETAALIRDTLGITFASHARLLELSQGLSIAVNSKVTEKRNLATGEVTLGFTEEHGDAVGGPLKIPGGFIVGIPVFRNGDTFQLVAQLRYRNRGGQLFWFYELYQPDRVFDVAFKGACEVVRSGTGLPLFYGSPE